MSERMKGGSSSPNESNGFARYMGNFSAIYGIFNKTGWQTINMAYDARRKMRLGLYPAVMNVLEGFDLDVGKDPSSLRSLNDSVDYCQRGLAGFLRRNGVVRDSTNVIEPIGEKNPAKVKKVHLTKWMLAALINYYVKSSLGDEREN
jgi:hypothetical protein